MSVKVIDGEVVYNYSSGAGNFNLPSEKVFQEFLDAAETLNIHHLRENATKDYIWTLYEPWDIKSWVSND